MGHAGHAILKSMFTPFRTQSAQRGPPFSLITAPEGGVLNEKRCKIGVVKGGFIKQRVRRVQRVPY